MNNIGALIRHLRRSKAMTQMELAEKMGISYQQVQKYEKGTSELTIKRLLQVADALSVPISTFIEEERDKTFHMEEMTDDEIKILTVYRRLKDKKKKHMAIKMLKLIESS